MPTSDSDLQAALDAQLAHCQKLLDAVTDAVQHWKQNGGQPFRSVADELIQAIFARSTRTYEAVVEHLGNRGFAEQGAMLNRTLFEDMVDARWVSLNPELAVERLRQHDRFSHALRLEVANRFPEYMEDALEQLDPPMSDEERNESKELFGRYGDGSWTGVSLYDRFKEVESTWAEGLARRQADFIRAWVQRLNNETLHLSAYSLARLGSPKLVNGELHFRLGSTEEFLTETLWSAFWTYAQTVWLVFERFGLQVIDELEKTVVTPAFAEFAQGTRQS